MQTKERPILFSAPMVRAILEGRKTQTRRVLEGQEFVQRLARGLDVAIFLGGVSPYGEEGDRLWVRETLRLNPSTNSWHYSADDTLIELTAGNDNVHSMISWAHHKEGDVCVSIHMPRWASRITLEIVNVRVERVQAISDEDGKAEGYDGRDSFLAGDWANSQEGNPFVWVIEFKRLEQ